MSRAGQVTISAGSRSLAIYDTLGGMRRLNIPVASAQLDYLVIWCYESVTALENDLKGAVYTTAGVRLAMTDVLANAITSNSFGTWYEAHIPFPAGTIIAGGDIDVAVAATGRGGTPVIHGDNGSTGTPVKLEDAVNGIYPTFPADYTGLIDIATPRQWDIGLEYTEVTSGSTLLLSLLQQSSGGAFV